MNGTQREPVWASYLIERFDLDLIQIGGASQETAVFLDRDDDVALHVGFNRGGVHLQLGTAPWSTESVGKVTSQRRTRGDSLAGHLGEPTDTLQDRRMHRLRAVFDSGCDRLYDAWVLAFGRRSIVADDREMVEIAL